MEVENIFGIAKAILIIPAVFWLIGKFGLPREWWRDAFTSPDPDRMATFARWKFNAGVAVLFFGLMFIAYDTCDAIMDWMPRSWGGVDEDGEWRAIRPTIQIILAFIITGSVLHIAHGHAEAVAKWPTDHDFTLAMIEDLERPVYRYEAEENAAAYRKRLIRIGRGVLTKKERHDDAFDLKAYRKRLIERLDAVEREIDAKAD